MASDDPNDYFNNLRRIIEDIFASSGLDPNILNDPDILKQLKDTGSIGLGYSFFQGPDGETKFQPLGNMGNLNPFGEQGNAMPIQSDDQTQDPSKPIEPFVDIMEDPSDNSIRVIVELPGVTKDAISLKSHKNNLKIRAQSERKNYAKDVELPEESIDVVVDPEVSIRIHAPSEQTFPVLQVQRIVLRVPASQYASTTLFSLLQ